MVDSPQSRPVAETDVEMLRQFAPLDRAVLHRVRAIHARLEYLLEDAITFWMRNGQDREHGGFFGTLNRFGESTEPTHKGLVQQVRHLWTFSAYHRHLAPTDRTKRAAAKALADDLLAFVSRHFLDPKDGEFILRVDRLGNALCREKHLYTNSFAIYGLSEYAMAFESEPARSMALNCFRSLDRSHDATYGGYDQTHRPCWLSQGAVKDTNTHLHLMECFTALFAATGDRLVWQRAEELVHLLLARHVQPSGQTHAEFDRTFTPVGPASISYGHDIETAWLVFDAIDTLQLEDAKGLRDKAYQLGANAAQRGFDAERGGFFEEGMPEGPPTKLEKVWWIQAEALAGLYRLYQHSNDLRFLNMLEQTLSFCETYLRDPNHGEWYWSVTPNDTLGQHRDNKGQEWKSSYHLVRGLLFTQRWMAQSLANSESSAGNS